MGTNSADITLRSAGQWIIEGFLQNWAVWVIGAAVAISFWAIIYWSMWVFDKHDVMSPNKRKHFFAIVVLITTVGFVLIATFCHNMNSETRLLNAQLNSIRSAAEESQKEKSRSAFRAGIIAMGITQIGDASTNIDIVGGTTQAIALDPQNKTVQSGINLLTVIHIANAGPPSTAWGFKASIKFPTNGKEIDASIPSVRLLDENAGVFTSTIAGPYKLSKDRFLLDSLSYSPLPSGGAGMFWMIIHINGISELPPGTHVMFSFEDVFGHPVKIDHTWVPNQ